MFLFFFLSGTLSPPDISVGVVFQSVVEGKRLQAKQNLVLTQIIPMLNTCFMKKQEKNYYPPPTVGSMTSIALALRLNQLGQLLANEKVSVYWNIYCVVFGCLFFYYVQYLTYIQLSSLEYTLFFYFFFLLFFFFFGNIGCWWVEDTSSFYVCRASIKQHKQQGALIFFVYELPHLYIYCSF